MKKRNKKYNPMKGALKSAKVGLRNLGVWHSQRNKSDYTAEVINYKTLKKEDVGPSMVFAITKVRHLWQILLLAIGEDDNGKKYFKVDPVQIKHEMYQSDLAEYLDKRHKDFIAKSFNKNHLTNVAWLAVPNGQAADSITDEQIDKIITANEAVMTGSVKHSYELGFKAAKKGDLISNNPYGEVSSVKKYAWLGGYNDYLAGYKLDLSIFNEEK